MIEWEHRLLGDWCRQSFQVDGIMIRCNMEKFDKYTYYDMWVRINADKSINQEMNMKFELK